MIAARGLPGHAREGGGGQSDPEYSQGEFHDPVGVVEIGDRASGKEGGEEGVDEHRDLHGGQAEGGRSEAAGDGPDGGVPPLGRRRERDLETMHLG